MLLAHRAATKDLHFCLSPASFCMVPQLWFRVFISASTVRRQVFLGRPRLRFPSGVQCRAVFVMDSLPPLLTTWPSPRLLIRMVAMLSGRDMALQNGLIAILIQYPCTTLDRSRQAHPESLSFAAFEVAVENGNLRIPCNKATRLRGFCFSHYGR